MGLTVRISVWCTQSYEMTMDFSAVVDTRRATRVTTQVGCRPSGLVILEGDEEEVREKNFLTSQVCLDFANLSTEHSENFPPIRP